MVESQKNDVLSIKNVLILAGIGAAVAIGTAVLLLWLAALVGLVDTAVLRSMLGMSEQLAWYFSRSSGTVAYLLLSGSTIWGLLLSTKLIKEQVPAVLSLGMHNVLSWLAILLTALHALALLFDSYYAYSFADLLVPFAGPYRPVWVGMGVLGLYVMVLTSASFYIRRQIGQKMWRALHYLTFLAYVLATVHGVMAGTDSANPGMQLVYWFSGLMVLFLTNYRLLSGKGGKKPTRRRAELGTKRD